MNNTSITNFHDTMSLLKTAYADYHTLLAQPSPKGKVLAAVNVYIHALEEILYKLASEQEAESKHL